MAHSSEPLSDELLATLGVPVGPEHECPYLPEQAARERAFMAERLAPGVYLRLMDFGWRRSGRILYKPACSHCSRCVPIRLPVAEFRPNRTQRKIANRNADIEWRLGEPHITEEKYELFVRYQEARHSGDMCTNLGDFERFLYESPIQSCEFVGSIDGRVAACAILDLEPGAISSVYTYFEPDAPKRSLGVASVLSVMKLAKTLGLAYYYLGYTIEGCAKMDYKTTFRPHELCDSCGNWSKIE